MEATGLTRKAVTRRIERGTLKVVRKNEEGARLIDEDDVKRLHGTIGFKPEPVQFEQVGKTASFSTAPQSVVDLSDTAEIIRSRNLNPDEWDVASVRLNEWDSPTGEVLTQLRVNLVRKAGFTLQPAFEPDDYVHPKRNARKPSKDKPELVVFVGDQQAPYHDENLHELFLLWLDENKPSRGILMGDTVDFPDISRHSSNPEWDRCVQDCINSGYLILRDYVQHSEETEWTKLMGNHDERIRARLLTHNTLLHDLRRADVPGEESELPVWNVGHLMRLDALGISLIEPNGGYAHAQAKLSSHLAARHGWIAKKGAGASALGTLEKLGYSVVVGHTHRQGLVHKTTHDIDGTVSTLAAVETGCMCRIKDGLGYTVAPDWQAGFATASIWPDGTFKLDLATYVNGILYWRDERYGK